MLILTIQTIIAWIIYIEAFNLMPTFWSKHYYLLGLEARAHTHMKTWTFHGFHFRKAEEEPQNMYLKGEQLWCILHCNGWSPLPQLWKYWKYFMAFSKFWEKVCILCFKRNDIVNQQAFLILESYFQNEEIPLLSSLRNQKPLASLSSLRLTRSSQNSP